MDTYTINAIIAYVDGSTSYYNSTLDNKSSFQISSDDFNQNQAELFSWEPFRDFIESIGFIALANPINISHISDIAWSVSMDTGTGKQVISGFEAVGGAGTTSNVTYTTSSFPSFNSAIESQLFEVLDLNPVAYFDASVDGSVILTDGKVSQWTDLSGLGNHVSQMTPGNRPTVSTLNGMNVLSFDAANEEYLITSSWDDVVGPPIEAFVVVKPVGSGGRGPFSISDADQPKDYFVILAGTTNLVFQQRGTGINPPNSVISQAELSNPNPNTMQLWSGRSASDESIFVKINQIESPEGTDRTIIQNLDTLTIGRLTRSGSKVPFDGQIAEVVVFNRILTADERSDLERHLIGKWRISV